MGAGGVGVGNLPDGRVVFVPRTAPGDLARVSMTREKKRFAWGRLEELLEASPERKTPPCPLYHRCGGCALQHLPYPVQLSWKGTVVGDALRRIGKLALEDPKVEPSPREFGYRNKISFTLRRLRGEGVVAGFHELEQPGRILDVGEECLLPMQGLGEMWCRLRAAWGPGATRLPRGRELRLTLRGEGEQGSLVIQGGGGDGDPGQLLARVPGLTSIWRQEEKSGIRHLAGAPTLQLTWLEEGLEVAGDAFLQVNPEAGQLLHGHVLSRARESDPRFVVEGYCGMGVLGKALAREGRSVVGIELEAQAAAEARRDSPPGFRLVEGRVEDHLQDLPGADLLILNPPRRGLGSEVPQQILELQADRIIYVSCDPATLARDLRRLEEGYRVQEVRAFDLFPQTGHVETVAVMKRGKGADGDEDR